jgi:hypothetical protein
MAQSARAKGPTFLWLLNLFLSCAILLLLSSIFFSFLGQTGKGGNAGKGGKGSASARVSAKSDAELKLELGQPPTMKYHKCSFLFVLSILNE